MPAWQGNKRGSSDRVPFRRNGEQDQSCVLSTLQELRSRQARLDRLLLEARKLYAEISTKLDRFGVPDPSTVSLLESTAKRKNYSVIIRRNPWQ